MSRSLGPIGVPDAAKCPRIRAHSPQRNHRRYGLVGREKRASALSGLFERRAPYHSSAFTIEHSLMLEGFDCMSRRSTFAKCRSNTGYRCLSRADTGPCRRSIKRQAFLELALWRAFQTSVPKRSEGLREVRLRPFIGGYRLVLVNSLDHYHDIHVGVRQAGGYGQGKSTFRIRTCLSRKCDHGSISLSSRMSQKHAMLGHFTAFHRGAASNMASSKRFSSLSLGYMGSLNKGTYEKLSFLWNVRRVH